MDCCCSEGPYYVKALQQQRQIFHTGVSLSFEDEKWALEQGIALAVSW